MVINEGIVLLSIVLLECAAELVDSPKTEEITAGELGAVAPGVISEIELEEREEMEDVFVEEEGEEWIFALLGSSEIVAGIVSLDS